MSKKKILFVVGDFFQAGAERYAYEIDKALDKEIFEVTILCRNTKEIVNNAWKRYYDKKHEKLGSDIIYMDAYMNKNRYILNKIRIFLGLNRIPTIKRDKLISFLDNYDLIHWMGEYLLYEDLPEALLKKSLVNVMTAKFQKPDLYHRFNFDYEYNFISGFTNEEFVNESTEFTSTKHWFFPLIFNTRSKKDLWSFSDAEVKKIGIFTRIDRSKPLYPFFSAFHLLKDKLPNVELHVFGNGDPEAEGINNYLRDLDIIDSVFFKGHQKDIKTAAIQEKIDLSWYQGYNGKPAGYAGFDICSIGVPLVCWDFFEATHTYKQEVYPHFKDLNLFVQESYSVLTDRVKAEKLSELQQKEVFESNDSARNIKDLEKIYTDLIQHHN